MSSRVFTVVCMFVASCMIGWNMRTTTTVQAAEPVIPSVVEIPRFIVPKVKQSVNEVNVEVDLSTLGVSVTGTTDAIVNVKTVGEPKPIVKWRTKVIERKDSSGYPYVKSIGVMPEDTKPVSPLSKVNPHE